MLSVRVRHETPILSVCRNGIDGDTSSDKHQLNVMLVESQNNDLSLWAVNTKVDLVVRIHLLTPILRGERRKRYESSSVGKAAHMKSSEDIWQDNA